MTEETKDLGNNYYKSGWQPSIEFDEQSGTGEITYVGTDPDYKNKYDDILKGWGFDPKYYEIEGTVRASSWEGQLKGGRTTTFFAFKGVVKRKNPALDEYFDELCKIYLKKPKLKNKKYGGNTAFIWTMADWQLGKADYGVENTLKRYEEALIEGVNQIKALRKGGTAIDEVFLLGLGDLTENCDQSFYSSMPFNVELTLRQQYELARRMIMQTIDTFLPHADKITVCGIGGNHGHMTRSGKGQVLTDQLDNSDIMHFEIAKEICKQNERYDKVKVIIPADYHHLLDIKGKAVAITHGHMTTGGAGPEGKIMKWWQGQMFGWLPSGAAELLLTAHYHHPRLLQQGKRTWIQCPSIDASKDFTARTGMWNEPGVLTLTVDKNGWDNLKIL
tara:strand:- start:9529 stop:10695 length:1167 start_codon:yes stop_codon:yes gene_type:complete